MRVQTRNSSFADGLQSVDFRSRFVINSLFTVFGRWNLTGHLSLTAVTSETQLGAFEVSKVTLFEIYFEELGSFEIFDWSRFQRSCRRKIARNSNNHRWSSLFLRSKNNGSWLVGCLYNFATTSTLLRSRLGRYGIHVLRVHGLVEIDTWPADSNLEPHHARSLPLTRMSQSGSTRPCRIFRRCKCERKHC